MKKIKSLLIHTLPVVCALALASSAAVASPAPPAVGESAPGFKLKTNEGKATSLKDYRGKWVVLYFYPKDFTSGCTLEAHSFQADLARYEKLNAVILGVSVDSVASHQAFCAKEGLNFKLLSDLGARVSTKYGSVMESKGVKMSARNTFLIRPDGKIAQVFLKVKPSGHSEEVLAALAEQQQKR